MEIKIIKDNLINLAKEKADDIFKDCKIKNYPVDNGNITINLDETSIFAILNGLEELSIINEENKGYVYEGQEDYSEDMNTIKQTYNNILYAAQSKGYFLAEKFM